MNVFSASFTVPFIRAFYKTVPWALDNTKHWLFWASLQIYVSKHICNPRMTSVLIWPQSAPSSEEKVTSLRAVTGYWVWQTWLLHTPCKQLKLGLSAGKQKYFQVTLLPQILSGINLFSGVVPLKSTRLWQQSHHVQVFAGLETADNASKNQKLW